ncbi:MAG: flagellar basal body-associated FliL family protein [Bacillota bacterium]
MNRGLIIALVAAVLVLAVGVAGIAGYVFLLMPKSAAAKAEVPEKKEETKKAPVEVKVYKMTKFVTNLADTDRLRYIDVTIGLGLKSAESETFVKDTEPQIRDIVLRQIRSLTATELAGAQGADRLAQAIEQGLAEMLKDHMTKVYVTDMVVQ